MNENNKLMLLRSLNEKQEADNSIVMKNGVPVTLLLIEIFVIHNVDN